MANPDELPDVGADPILNEDDEQVSDNAENEFSERENAVPGSDDEEGEDLINDNMANEYREMPHLDRYEEDGLDEEFEDDATYAEQQAARRAADAALDRADRKRKLPGALEEDDDEEDAAPRRRRRVDIAQGGDMEAEGGDVFVEWETAKGSLTEWLEQDRVKNELARCFRKMLKNYMDEETNQLVYPARIADMVKDNRTSLEVSFVHISQFNANVAMWVVDAPREVLNIFNDIAFELVKEEFEDFENIARDVFVRITELPIVDNLRDIRKMHLGSIIKVMGVVTRRTQVYPQLLMVTYDCVKCGNKLGPFMQNQESEVTPNQCPMCESRGPFQVSMAETVYRNYQKLMLQESPGTVPAGRLPRSKEVILLHDLIDQARPGDEIELTGIYSHSYDRSMNVKAGFPVFTTSIEANYISRKEDKFALYHLTDEDRAEIHKLARDPRIGERIIKSIAPSIYGHEVVKAGVALALFGGQEKHVGQHRLRGDINVLLLGDPGTAKSQFLKYIEKTAHRAVFTTGKGASAVGLTASVHRDPITREWTLEGGALVLADRGVCLIDEFDKMNDQDRTSIHEAMEQQSISLSKAGIVTTLQARAAVIAAANPIGGRYDSSRTFSENVELSDPILSRFDVVCVIKDTVDPILDERLAEFVVGSHARSHPDAEDGGPRKEHKVSDDAISQDMLKKYVTYAKQHCKPKLSETGSDKLVAVYADLRREAAVTHAMPVAVRHLESMVRMSEAHAAMHLRDHVTADDIDMAIRMMLESFIGSQKFSVQKSLRRKFSKYLVQKQDYNELLMHLLRSLLREQLRMEAINALDANNPSIAIPCRMLVEKAREYNITDLRALYQSNVFRDSGFELDNDRAQIVHAR